MKIFLLRQYYSLILLYSNVKELTFLDRARYIIKAVATFGPVAFVMDKAGIWFSNNELFFRGMLIAILINMLFGYAYHKKCGDFKWRFFWGKNIEMWVIIICVYPLLEVLSAMAGDNVIGETFKISVQISTILYPGSKALKNAHLMSERRYPPAFLMNKFYTFEKTGDISELFKKENDTPGDNAA